MFAYRRCEEAQCVVDPLGVATACSHLACPACGSGGSNLLRLGGTGARAFTCAICGGRFSGGPAGEATTSA